MKLNGSTYDSYKDSEHKWIGQLPESWSYIPNKHLFKLKKNQVGKNAHKYDLLSLTLQGIIKRDMENPQGKFPEEFDTYQEVKKGDFVFCLFDVEETPRAVGLSNFDGMITGAYTVLGLRNELSKEYFYYYYLNLDNKKKLKPLYKGLRNTIPKDSFFGLKSFVPPKPEQTAIANFLDDKTARIDQAIAQKERMIELLQERKQIIIQNAVTKGLDSNVKMKDSGVEWIGKIPEHWEISKLRYLGTTQNGISAGGEYFGSGFPFLTYSDVYNNTQIPESFSGLALSTPKDQLQFSVREGDVFFTRTSETMNEVGFSSTCFKTVPNSTFAGFLIRFRPSTNKLFKGFSKYYFSSNIHRSYFTKEMNLVTRASLSQELLKSMTVLLPSIKEQETIFNYLENYCEKFNNSIRILNTQIQKLKEYKTTLIDHAVTGKIKVS